MIVSRNSLKNNEAIQIMQEILRAMNDNETFSQTERGNYLWDDWEQAEKLKHQKQTELVVVGKYPPFPLHLRYVFLFALLLRLFIKNRHSN